MKRRCPKCSHAWEGPERIGVREECPECAAFIHTCVNCGRFEPSVGQCSLPDTEAVRDPTGVNFCEEFEFDATAQRRAAAPAVPPPSAQDEARRKFEDLFRDGKP